VQFLRRSRAFNLKALQLTRQKFGGIRGAAGTIAIFI
jgi:hypothetical protein